MKFENMLATDSELQKMVAAMRNSGNTFKVKEDIDAGIVKAMCLKKTATGVKEIVVFRAIQKGIQQPWIVRMAENLFTVKKV